MAAVKVRLYENDNQWMPAKGTPGSAAWDLRARLESKITIVPGEVTDPIPTGVFLEIPSGYEAQIRPRSGLGGKLGITIPNSPGTIDSDYRGEILVPLVCVRFKYNNPSFQYKAAVNQPVVIEPGMRIAQMVIQKLPKIDLKVVEELSDTDRGEGGFGSTGH